ncbi:Lrp/AsnC family transcriptional regulator [Sphingomonas sp. C3-2]|uniref:Lrp/AsnC family transcriptional regulator n=1 Tax=Sphingomonas sp. C3-2 TaxID=3062169 RepID=UPI00294AA501|nr:Lrp/AsnC family transcriptional regulator [Sphingomonas sp. C3-2]WOK38181.1 Lrp/AsnC family transcriptional regulator [Sphingomonas sp. C3-2]
MAKPTLDDLDRKLIDLLAKDARVSNRQIAAKLDVTEGTVRARIKRLQQENLIRFTAITGITTLRLLRPFFVYVSADPAKVRPLAEEIAGLPQIHAVLTTLGRHNILVIGLFADLEDVMTTATQRIVELPGVYNVETSIAVSTLKYNPRVVRITGTPPHMDENDEEAEG